VQAIIRQASIADREALFDFVRVAYGDRAKHKIPDRWKWYFQDNPFLRGDGERLPIWIAIKDGRIVGQWCAVPVEMKIGEEVRQASWGIDLIVLPTCRGEGLASRLFHAFAEHYELRMSVSMTAITRHIYTREGSISVAPVSVFRRLVGLNRRSILLYVQARLRRWPWLHRAVRIGCQVFQFDRVFALPVNAALGLRDLLERRTKREPRTQIREVERFGDEIDQLWNATSHQFGVIAKRDRIFLNWRFADDPLLEYRSFVATRDGEPKGYLVLRKCQPIELNMGKIVDLYASRDDEETLDDLIRHAIHVFGREVMAIECAVTPLEYRRALSRFGFREKDRVTPLVFCTDAGLRAKLDALKDRWFLTKGDQDWDRLSPV
jgi:GNAT superfamily N-acetyltransferase